MTDQIDQSDPLTRVVTALQPAPPLAPDFAARVGRRRVRRDRRMRSMQVGIPVLAIALLVVFANRSGGTSGVTFRINAPDSLRRVALVGDFTDWDIDKVQLASEGEGRWKVTLKLPPGRYRFAYVLNDDEWRADASAAPALDDFGRPTSVLTVAP